ncbi:MAG: ArsR family transcriptional regulator [Nitrospirae bacterium]|nr:MAG: ArsR family transcriptional regulator [Nitrospirota bacterium]
MLEKLFSSSTRADLLALLLNSPEEKFYLREIAGIIHKNPAGVKRELDRLERLGIVKSERVANLKYFSANTSSPLYHELKRLITKSLGLPGALKAVLRGSGAIIAFIYGAYAEGLSKDSINLFVVGGLSTIAQSLKEIEREFNVTIELKQVSEADYRRLKREESETARMILEGKKIILLGRP